MNKKFAIFFAMYLIFLVSACGSKEKKEVSERKNNRDVPIELIPKKQKDLLTKYIDLKSKIYDNSKSKTINAIVKKETSTSLMKDFKDFLNNLNEHISSNGVKDWAGTVLVNSSSIELYVYVKTNLGTRQLTQQLVHITIPTTGMNKNVYDTVKILTTGNLVNFSIESTKEFQLKFNENGHLYSSVKPSNFNIFSSSQIKNKLDNDKDLKKLTHEKTQWHKSFHLTQKRKQEKRLLTQKCKIYLVRF